MVLDRFLNSFPNQNEIFDVKVVQVELKTDEEGKFISVTKAELKEAVSAMIRNFYKVARRRFSSLNTYRNCYMFNEKTGSLSIYFFPSNFALHRDWEHGAIYSNGKVVNLVDVNEFKELKESGAYINKSGQFWVGYLPSKINSGFTYSSPKPGNEVEIDEIVEKLLHLTNTNFAKRVKNEDGTYGLEAVEGLRILPENEVGAHQQRQIMFAPENFSLQPEN